MSDEEKTREELLTELRRLQSLVADLEKSDSNFKKIETDLLGKNRECQLLTAELEDKYRTIRMHESMLNQSLEELKEKNLELEQFNRQLQRKKLTIRVLGILLAILMVSIGVVASLGPVEKFARSYFEYRDDTYRPMDREREGKPHPTQRVTRDQNPKQP